MQGASPPPHPLPLSLSTVQLVFSDEFETAGRLLGVGAADPRWTAEHMWYAGTQNYDVYLPEQVGGRFEVEFAGDACEGVCTLCLAAPLGMRGGEPPEADWHCLATMGWRPCCAGGHCGWRRRHHD